jgi:hypothetical protein
MKIVNIVVLIILSILTLTSLALNGIAIIGLMRSQEIGLDIIDQTRTMLGGLRDDTFVYTFKVDQEFPFKTTFPVNEEFTVPVQTTIPVNTTFVVPIDLGITTYNFKVPINTVFPVDMEFTVPVSMGMDVDIVVPLELEIPVEIALAETPLIGYLDEADVLIDDLEAEMTANPIELYLDRLRGVPARSEEE